MSQVMHKRSSDEPEGGWLGPRGPDGWADLEELDRRQREQLASKRRKR
jgi:hypothetical protein